MTRFAADLEVLNKLKTLQDLKSEGSIDYLTPYMSSQQPPTDDSGGRSYFDYIEDKREELDEIIKADGGPWREPDESIDPIDADPDPVITDTEPEINPERKAAQEELIKRYSRQIAEDGGDDYARIIADSLRRSRVATPKNFEDFKWAFEGEGGLGAWKKIGGGNKMGSGGGAVNAARRARAATGSSGPGLGFHAGQAVRGIKARFSDTQGKGIPTGADGYRGHM